MECNICPRQCYARRDNNKGYGYCGMPESMMIARAGLHFWEEPCISGTKGSGTVFFGGCSLKCCYCQNSKISFSAFGKTQTPEQLSCIFRDLENMGAHNINLVTPTHYTYAIRQALEIYKPKIPIVYNSSGYDTIQQIDLLKNYVDIYLMDFKYISNDRALRYSNAADYPKIAAAAIKHCAGIVGEIVLNENGIMEKGLIVRHLVLPQGTSEAMRVIDWVADNLPDFYLSIMSQYIPCGNINNFKELQRKITKREYEKVLEYASDKNIKQIYIQKRTSSTEKYIPAFDLSGTK